MTQLRIFLSHSSRDKAVADTFARALRGAGADVWYDEESLGAGHLRRIIMQELASRPVFIVLLSKVALASQWVLDECEWAYDLQRNDPSRILLPVVVTPLDWADLNVALYLRSLKRVEAGDLQPLPPESAAAEALRLLDFPTADRTDSRAVPHQESADDLVTRGKALVARGQATLAIPLFERATQLAPDRFDAWFNLGYADASAHRWAASLAAWGMALTIKPHDAVTWANRAAALNSLGRAAEGLDAADQAISLNAEEPLAWNNKASALNKLGRYPEGLAAAERAISLKADYASAWSNKAALLLGLKRLAEALAAYDRALSFNTQLWAAWVGKSVTLRALESVMNLS